MTRETIGLTAYRLIFRDGSVAEIASVALIDVLQRCGSHKPHAVIVLDKTAKEIDQESIDFLWNKIQDRASALHQ
jgi:hypothetical protein